MQIGYNHGMPELPEVETIARKLQLVLPSKVITRFHSLHPKTLQGDVAPLLNQPIQAVSRRSKIIRLHFPAEQNILIHLKMTGQLIYLDDTIKLGGGHPTADWTSALPSGHTRLWLEFADASKLFFNDQRLFGWWKVTSDAEVAQEFATFALDANSPELDPLVFYQKIHTRGVPIKQLIMDNTIIAGVGNIYACDALNVAQISPWRPGKTLSRAELDRLLAAIQLVILQGIEMGGTTFDGKYVDIAGMAGSYQSVVRVYGREGQACQNCGGTIVKEKLGGRGTYYCLVCQT